MSQSAFSWITEIEERVAKLADIPLWGNPPPLPLEKILSALKEALKLETLKITSQTVFRKNCLEEMESSVSQLTLSLSPLDGKLFLLFPESEIERLVKNSVSADPFTLVHLKAGYTRFIMLQILEALHEANALPGLYPQLIDEAKLPEEGAMCADLTVDTGNGQMFGRIVMSPDFYESYREHYKGEKTNISDDPRSDLIPLDVRAKLGSVELSVNEWNAVKEGDFIALDDMIYQPGEKEPECHLAFEGRSLLRGRLQGGTFTAGEKI